MKPTLNATDAHLVAAFKQLTSADDVANLLEVPRSVLTYHLFSKAGKRYQEFDIPKRHGGIRKISTPNPGLKCIQSKLNRIFQLHYQPKVSVHGFIKGESILENAVPHADRNFVFNVDLLDFFPSIHFGRVRGVLQNWPYGQNLEVATIMSNLCCRDGSLPQGAPTSPILSNMVCYGLDGDLLALAKNYGCDMAP